MSTAKAFSRANILGTLVTTSTFDGALDWLDTCVQARRPLTMSAATVYSVMLGHGRPGYRATVNSAGYVMADGMPLVWAARLLKHPAERVHGDDFMLACCARFLHWRHFLVGGAPGQPEQIARALRQRFPGIQVVGSHATPLRPPPAAETERIIQAIHESEASMVWVGMGTPAQDDWMAAHGARVGIPLAGVGSVFNLLAGHTGPTPGWMKRSGLQWLFRLMQEPRRLTYRYLVYNPLFIWHFLLQYLGLRKYRTTEPTEMS